MQGRERSGNVERLHHAHGQPTATRVRQQEQHRIVDQQNPVLDHQINLADNRLQVQVPESADRK